MRIITTRRISQIFFFNLFLWFCVVTTLGDAWWQLRGWPVNWIIELDPFVGLGTLLTTRTIYAGLLWGLVTLVLTLLLGRFFCGWICPFGAIHQFVGYLARRKKSMPEKINVNRYSRWQALKYWILIFLLAAAVADLLAYLIRLPLQGHWFFWMVISIVLAAAAILTATGTLKLSAKWFIFALLGVGIWTAAGYLLDTQLLSASLQIGLLDPIPLVYRSVNLILLPLIDATALKLTPTPRFYAGSWLIGTIFLTAVFLNLKEPRFYCRYICPLGALFGVLGRYALGRIGKTEAECLDCHLCDRNCEGACSPSATIRINECVLCLNCLDDCHHNLIGYRTAPSAAGEIVDPDVSRRQFVISTITGIAAIPVLRLNGHLAANWNPKLIRPPGALTEGDFLTRCIKCGQCMRICPTNVIQPAGLEGGLEGLWTPVLNFRIGTSGCQHKCIACGNICPTAAIRPISLDERLGKNRFVSDGPIRIGTDFVDRGRCLPWAMDTPCIVCQENCPVSPKAIITREVFIAVLPAKSLIVQRADARQVEFEENVLEAERYATGDYHCRISGQPDSRLRQIVQNTSRGLTVSDRRPWSTPPAPGSRVEIYIRLQQPYVKPEYCIGCGICEHECPVRGKRAIRVSAENESRDRRHRMVLST